MCLLTENKIEENGFSLIKTFDLKSISERHLEKNVVYHFLYHRK